MYLSDGNKKIDKACKIWNLPTTVCFGKGKQCSGCYAKKAEYFYPSCMPCRTKNLKASVKSSFVLLMNLKLKFTRKKLFRIHESGDFYSQVYLDKWTEICLSNPKIKFYGYSKKFNKLDFTLLNSLENVNIINSLADGLINFGSVEYCKELVLHYGSYLCPCTEEIKCMKDCFKCLTKEKVCFIQH